MYVFDNQIDTFILNLFICNNLKIKSMELCKFLSDFFSAKFIEALQSEI